MEKEEFGFSFLQPSLFVLASPGLYYFFSDRINLYAFSHSLLLMILAIPLVLFIYKHLRITLLMLFRRPALTLTSEVVTITESGYSIYWADVKDVYLADSISGVMRSPKTRFIIISVREPEKYIKAIKNPFTRYYRWATRGFWSESPFEISLFLVSGDDDEIYHQVLRYFQNNRGF